MSRQPGPRREQNGPQGAVSGDLFHKGSELFNAFGASVESEFRYADFCRELIWIHRDGIRFTPDALLITDLRATQDDWTQADSVRFYPWYNVLALLNIKGARTLHEYTVGEIKSWLSSLPVASVTYPLLHAEPHHLALAFVGTPRSFRSKGGRARLKADVEAQRRAVEAGFGSPLKGRVELMIDVFATESVGLPDVDRFSNSVMDAFQGVAYEDDRQVIDLRPRVFESREALKQLEVRSEPMPHFELEDVPPSSLFPLSQGIVDYYVVRVRVEGYR